jgi:hypothetical protein
MESLKPLVNFAGTDLLKRVTEEYRQNKQEEIKEIKLANELYEKAKHTTVWSSMSSLFTSGLKVQ